MPPQPPTLWGPNLHPPVLAEVVGRVVPTFQSRITCCCCLGIPRPRPLYQQTLGHATVKQQKQSANMMASTDPTKPALALGLEPMAAHCKNKIHVRSGDVPRWLQTLTMVPINTPTDLKSRD